MGHVASAMWTCAITVHLFITITLRAVDLADKLVIIFYIFGWGVPCELSSQILYSISAPPF